MVCQCILASLSWTFIVYILYRLTVIVYRIIYPYFIASPIDLRKAAGGKWAVVTGSTDGIGKEYAFQLAKHGFSIVLISRTQSKLNEVKKELENEHKIEVKTIAFDFTSASTEQYEKIILSEIRKIDVGILVNNVGVSFNYPEKIHQVEDGLQKLADVNIVNTLPTTLISAAILPQMIERNSGIVVNISSAASYSPVDMLSVYSASKKFINWLTSILQNEYSDKNIIFQVVCPMVVATKMSKVSHPSFFFVKAEDFVKSAIKTIGVMDETAGCFPHQIQAEFIKNLPDWIIVPYLSQTTKLIRKKALAKKLREAQKS